MNKNLDVKITGDGFGYVYVMSYPGSDKVKIGHSLNPTARAKDIGGTLAPEEPVLQVCFWCSERREDVERRAHLLRASVRANGEWFRLSAEEAVATVRQAASDLDIQVQLTYTRADWEASMAAKIARVPQMTDHEIGVVLTALPKKREKGKWGLEARVISTPFEQAVADEYSRRMKQRQEAHLKGSAPARVPENAQRRASMREAAKAWVAEAKKAARR